jgi:hypothetical protein
MADVVSLGIHILAALGRPVTRIPPKQDVDLLEEIRLAFAGTTAGISVNLAKLGVNVATRLVTAAAALVITGLDSDAGIIDFDHTVEFMGKAETLPMTEG